MAKRVKMELLAHIKTKEDRELFQKKILSAWEVLERIQAILETKRETATAEQESKNAYSDASWPMLQADRIGYRRALKEVIELISLTGDA